MKHQNTHISSKFITVEGIEGVGKSTAMRFIQAWLEQQQIDFILSREPGGTLISEEIRQIFLQPKTEIMHADTEVLLIFAARAQHLQQIIWPALAEGKWVICDRFTDTSYAYQGGGRGVNMERLEVIENWVQGNFRPDAVILLDASVDICLERARQRGQPDRIEAEKAHFFERARAVYLQRAALNPERYKLVDATRPLVEIQRQIEAILTIL